MLPAPSKCPTIVDLGCGPGIFASFLVEKGYKSYIGLDFSIPLISSAANHVPSYIYVCGDLRRADALSLLKNYSLFVALEFLEHINNDLAVIESLSPKSRIILSVPNYDSAGHVRHFKGCEEAVARYSPLLRINAKNDVHGSLNKGVANKMFVLDGIKK